MLFQDGSQQPAVMVMKIKVNENVFAFQLIQKGIVKNFVVGAESCENQHHPELLIDVLVLHEIADPVP